MDHADRLALGEGYVCAFAAEFDALAQQKVGGLTGESQRTYQPR
jgi:hypothetical protein